MKKNYVKPAIAVEEILLEAMIATSGTTTVKPDEPVIPGEANEKRGWGNLWD